MTSTGVEEVLKLSMPQPDFLYVCFQGTLPGAGGMGGGLPGGQQNLGPQPPPLGAGPPPLPQQPPLIQGNTPPQQVKS